MFNNLFGTTNQMHTRATNIFGQRPPRIPETTKIFQDQNSPWSSIPERIKSQFDQQMMKQSKLKIEKIVHNFDLPDESHKFCSHIIKKNQEYYQCWTCKKSSADNSILLAICSNCFDKKQHHTHYYTQDRSSRPVFCLCGKDLFLDTQQSFTCLQHSKIQESVPINNDKLEQFCRFWRDFLKIFLYLQKQLDSQSALLMIGRTIFQQLSKLASNNTNIQMIYDLLFNEKYAIQQKLPLGSIFLKKSSQASQLIVSLLQNKKLGKISIKQLIKNNFFLLSPNSINSNILNIIRLKHDLTTQLYPSHTLYLYQEQTAAIVRKTKNVPQFIDYLKSREKELQQKVYIEFIVKIMQYIRVGKIIKQIAPFLLPKLLQYYLKEQNGIKSPQKKICTQLTFKKCINKLIFSLCDGSPQKIANFIPNIRQSYFNEYLEGSEKSQFNAGQQVDKENLIKALHKFVLMHLQIKKRLCYPHLMLTIGFEEQQKRIIISRYYQIAFLKKPSHSLFFSSSETDTIHLEQIFYIIIAILHYRLYFKKFEDVDFQSDFQIQQQRKYREKLLRECVYEMKSLKNIRAIKDEFRIPNFKQIINQMCNYDFQSNNFFFNENSVHKNKLVLFLAQIFGKNLSESLLDFSILSSPFFQNLDAFQQKMIDQFLVKSSLYDQIQKAWALELKNSGNINAQLSEKYLQNLIFIQILSQGKHCQINRQLKQYIENEESRKLLYTKGRKDIINKLLGIQEVENTSNSLTQVENIDKQKSEALKIKSEDLKKKKYAIMKEKRSLLLNSLESEFDLSRKISDEGELCLLCRQKQKPNNRLVFLSKIIYRNTESKSIFGDSDIPQTNIFTCFHSIHIDCYLKQIENNSLKNCPLCSKKFNCILPHYYYKDSKKANRICTNTIINTYFNEFKVLDIESLFIVLFKHLVESKGLKTLINPHKSIIHKKRLKRINQYIQNLLEQIYNQSSQEIKQEYSQNIHSLLQQIKLVKNQSLRDIQQMLVLALSDKIRQKSDFNTQTLTNLVKRIKIEDFMIIKQQLQDYNIQLDSECQELISNKGTDGESISKVYPIKPPQYAYQLIEFGDKLCTFCSKNYKQSICLICGKTMCQSCNESKSHPNIHPEKMLLYSFHTSKIQFFSDEVPRDNSRSLFSRSVVQYRRGLYYNDIMVELSEIGYDSKKDQFKLSETVFNKFVGYLQN